MAVLFYILWSLQCFDHILFSNLTYLCKTSSEEHTFKQFSHLFQELIYKRSLQHVHLVNSSIYLYRYYEICIAYWLKIEKEQIQLAEPRRDTNLIKLSDKNTTF